VALCLLAAASDRDLMTTSLQTKGYNTILACKRVLLRSRFGIRIKNARDHFDLIHSSKRHFEEVGSIANDNLCRKLMTQVVLPNRTFLDIGSHIGSVIADINHHCPTSTVIAFEAMPDKAAHLRSQFPQTRIEQFAVGSKAGDVSFHVDLSSSGCSSLSTRAMPASDKKTIITVPMKPLDDFDLPSDVDAMKIDVEGAEQGVILGGGEFLTAQRPIIYFESGPGDIPELGFTKTGLWSVINDLAYTVHVPHRVAHADKGLTLEMFLDSHEYPRRTTNYIAIPTERRDEYRQRVREHLKF
jgi:FkbM family methyltransferase